MSTHRSDHDTCKHCDVPIIKFPDLTDKWMHDNADGVRLYRCKGLDTMAEPA